MPAASKKSGIPGVAVHQLPNIRYLISQPAPVTWRVYINTNPVRRMDMKEKSSTVGKASTFKLALKRKFWSPLLLALLGWFIFFSANAQKTEVEPKDKRSIIGFSFTKQNYRGIDAIEEDEWMGVPGFKLAFERLGLQKEIFPALEHPDYGIGFASTNLIGFYWSYGNSMDDFEDYTLGKHYLSSYLFREFHLKNIISFGLSAGPGINITWARSYEENVVNPNRMAATMGGGLHTAQYAQKFIGKKKKVFVRYGWDQFFMIGTGFTGSGTLAVGF